MMAGARLAVEDGLESRKVMDGSMGEGCCV